MQCFFSNSDTYKNTNEYPFFEVKGLTFLQWVMVYVTLPIAWPLCIKYWESRDNDRNCIKPHPKFMSGVIKCLLPVTISMKKAKQVAKSHGVGLNDMMLALQSVAFKEYFLKQKDETEMVSITCPFSFKTIPRDHKKYTFGNDFISLTIYLPLESDFKVACRKAKEKNDDMRKSMLPTGFYLMMKLVYNGICPQAWIDWVNYASGKKHSFLFSNIPCFVKPTEWFGGYLCKRFICMTSGPGNLSTSVTCTSITKRAQLTLCSDQSQVKDLQLLTDIFNGLINKYGMAYDPREEGDD